MSTSTEPTSGAALTAQRLRAMRIRLTVLYTLVSAIGIAALAAFVLVADSGLRSDALDQELRLKAVQGVRSVWYDNTKFHFESVRDDVTLARGYPQVYVTEIANLDQIDAEVPDVKVRVTPVRPRHPDAPVTETASQTILSGSETVRDGTSSQGAVRVLALPIKYGEQTSGAIVAVAAAQPLRDTQDRLRLLVGFGAGGLLLLSALAGHLLAGRSIRPAAEALSQQERFLADAAHEIRTPVAAIRALAEGAAHGDQPAEEALARTAVIAGEATQTVDDLLLLARADAGREPLHREPMRLDLLVEELIDGIPGVELVAEPTVVNADPRLLRRAIGNLVANAERHGRSLDPTAPITVTVTDGRVEVDDAGPGIDPGLEETLFDRFASGRRGGGTGLGLPLARWVAEAHGGTLTVAAREGTGARFVLTIPAASR
jgi:two-component system, OmpR family, sensor kinase